MKPSLIPDTAQPLGLELVESFGDLAAIDNPAADLGPLFEAASRNPVSHFKGHGVQTSYDETRLDSLYGKVFDLMKDQHWRTLKEIQEITGGMDGSISRMLRYMDDPYVGRHHKERRIRGDQDGGLWEYRIIPRGTNAFNNWLRDQGRL